MTEPTIQISLRDQYFFYKVLATLRGKCPGERFPFRATEESFAALYVDGINLVAEAHLHLQVEESGHDLISYSEQMASMLLASVAVLDRDNVDLLVEQSMILGFKSFLYQESASRIRYLQNREFEDQGRQIQEQLYKIENLGRDYDPWDSPLFSSGNWQAYFRENGEQPFWDCDLETESKYLLLRNFIRPTILRCNVFLEKVPSFQEAELEDLDDDDLFDAGAERPESELETGRQNGQFLFLDGEFLSEYRPELTSSDEMNHRSFLACGGYLNILEHDEDEDA